VLLPYYFNRRFSRRLRPTVHFYSNFKVSGKIFQAKMAAARDPRFLPKAPFP
jgi:hypothetical protein